MRSSASTTTSVVRYVTWIGDVVTGDLGRSFRTNQPVWDGLKQRIPVSLELMFLAQLFSLVIAVPLGIYSAYRPGRTVDRASTTIGFGMIAMPNFVLALLLILLFASKLGWLPSSGYVRFTDDPWGNLQTHAAAGADAGRRSDRRVPAAAAAPT